MNEIIFGTLYTLDKRVAYSRTQQRGVWHRNRLEPRAPCSVDRPRVMVTVELDQPIERVECRIIEPEPAVFLLHPIQTEWDLLNWSYFQTWQVVLPPQPTDTIVRYQIFAYPADGSQPVAADNGQIFSYLVDASHPPSWAADAVIYQLFPDRFYPGDGKAWNKTTHLSDIYGGTLRGVIDKLDYIGDLGFNCIWLNPFFPDRSHHGYHATDYFSVNPRLGTLADVQELVAAAHDRGIRLLLDFVANHVGRGHHAFQAALADRNSEYYDWFYWNQWPHDYKAYFDVPELPALNVENPAVRDYLFRSASYWLGEIGFDGLRLDYALGPSHDFWTELRSVVQRVKPDVWLFGEAVEIPPVQLSYEGRFHGCLDFMLAQALRDTFAFGTMNVAAFDNFLNQHEAYFPPAFSRPCFLDNHDMNRFLWLAQNDRRKLKLAALCQFTLCGPPIVYNGTEVGVTQERAIHAPDSHGMEECRQPMLWGEAQDQDLLNFYKWLIHFRHAHPVLWRGRRETIHLDADAGTYAYVRRDETEAVLVVLNVSNSFQQLDIDGHRFELAPWSGDTLIME